MNHRQAAYNARKSELLEESKADKRWVWNDGGREEFSKGPQRFSFTGDCCVRSIAIASKRRYDLVWNTAKAFKDGALPSAGMVDDEWMGLLNYFTEISTFRRSELHHLRGKVLRDVLPYLRGGGFRYVIDLKHRSTRRKCGHLACVIGGKLHDTWNCQDMIVVEIYPVLPKKKLRKKRA